MEVEVRSRWPPVAIQFVHCSFLLSNSKPIYQIEIYRSVCTPNAKSPDQMTYHRCIITQVPTPQRQCGTNKEVWVRWVGDFCRPMNKDPLRCSFFFNTWRCSVSSMPPYSRITYKYTKSGSGGEKPLATCGHPIFHLQCCFFVFQPKPI